MKGCGRSATSPSRGRSSAPRTGRCYKAVNQKFADIVVAEARNERPIVLIQDYHFALLPRMIRERLPEAIIITFWHIPWPNSEVFSICPWREQILDGLLGSSIVGFHIQFHCNNFIESVDRFLESRIEREHSAISYGGQTTLVHSYPISIEWPPAALETQPPVAECRRKIFERFGLSPDIKLLVGVERLDYTKGILDRFLALDELFATASRMDRPAGLPADRRAQPRHAARLPAPAPGMPELRRRRSTSATAATATSRSSCSPSITTQDDIYKRLPRRRCLRGQQPARRHEPGGQGVRRGARRRAGRADPQHLRRRLARAARGADRQSVRRDAPWARPSSRADHACRRSSASACGACARSCATTTSIAGPAACCRTRRGCASAARSRRRRHSRRPNRTFRGQCGAHVRQARERWPVTSHRWRGRRQCRLLE